ncbi:hypothetical protein [Candidatus Pristimantibacillus sp. PTI5]
MRIRQANVHDVGDYSRLGGQVFSQKDIRIGNETLTELAMGWSDINEGMF